MANILEMEEELFYNVPIGGVFEYEGALFVCMEYDYDREGYPSRCLSVKNPFKYADGLDYFFKDTDKVNLIYEKELRKLIPDRDYEP